MINGNLILYFFSQTPLINIGSKLTWRICGDSNLTWVIDRCEPGDTWIINCEVSNECNCN
jgi:hypothetical protein